MTQFLLVKCSINSRDNRTTKTSLLTSLTSTLGNYSRLHVLALVLMLGEEFFALLDVGLDGVTSWLPASGTNCKEKSTMSL